MKYLVCVLTFLSYSSFHMLRMTYSFNKIYIKQQLNLSNFYLGLLDALVYLSLGIGTFLRYTLIRNPIQLTKIYLATAILATLSISVVSVLGLISDYQNITHHPHYLLYKIFITLVLIIFGFTQLTSRPIATTLLGDELNTQQHGCIIGVWASHSSAGHITGLTLSNILVHILQVKWQVSIFLSAIICLSGALLVYFFLQNPLQKQPKNIAGRLKKREQDQFVRHSSRQFYRFIKRTVKQKQYLYYLSSHTVIKTMAYTFLLWYPIFLYSLKLTKYAGFITMLFQVAAIFGSFLLGKLYQYDNIREPLFGHSQKNQGINQQTPLFIQRLASLKSLISMVLVVIIITLFFIFPPSVLKFCLFSFGIGFFLGGTLNTMGSHDILIFANHNPRIIDYLTNFNIGVGSIFIGLMQLLVGVTLYEKGQPSYQEDQKHKRLMKHASSYTYLFIMLLVMGIIVSLIFFLKIFIKRKKPFKQNQFESLVDQLQQYKSDFSQQEDQNQK